MTYARSDNVVARTIDPNRRSCIIVGATGDIGCQVAALLHEDNFDLTLTHLRSSVPGNFPEVNGGPEIRWRRLNTSDSEAVQRIVDEAEEAHGEIYALVYCTGTVRDRPLLLTPDDVWKAVLDINLTGAFYCIRAVSRSMMVAGRGRIILIGSVAARCGNPGQASYSAAKGGLEAYCRVAAAELGRYGVSCNVVAPGAIESRLFRHVDERIVKRTIQATPLQRLGEPRDVASTVRYLLSDDAAFITGQTFVVDGGFSAI